MPEDTSQDPYIVPIEQFNRLQAERNLLKRSKQRDFGFGVLTGGTVVTVIALLYSSCKGCQGDLDKNDTDAADVSYNNSDSGNTDAYNPKYLDAQVVSPEQKACKKGQSCYNVKYVDDLERKLQACLGEKEKLPKQPESCPTYTPNACPPVKECPKAEECPQTPYIRKGD